jgi:hypothetical protein
MRRRIQSRNATKPPPTQPTSAAMLSIAHVWSFLIHVPFLGGALVVLILWKLVGDRLGGSRR